MPYGRPRVLVVAQEVGLGHAANFIAAEAKLAGILESTVASLYL